jgi:hypothetical protein
VVIFVEVNLVKSARLDTTLLEVFQLFALWLKKEMYRFDKSADCKAKAVRFNFK